MRIADDERRRYPGGIARNRILIQYASAYPRAITARDPRDARARVCSRMALLYLINLRMG